jgi:hypothetical protein
MYNKKIRFRNGNGDDGNGIGDAMPGPVQVTGRNIAHGHRDPGQRGALGAQLVLGEAHHTKPTILQVAAILHVSVPYVRLALDLQPGTRARVAAGEISLSTAAQANGLLASWIAATPEERAALGIAVGVDRIWDGAIAPSI